MSAAAPRKRPWYLVVALLGALAFGAGGASDGYGIWTFYHEGRVDPVQRLADIANDADRAVVARAFEHLLDAMDLAKDRLYPLGVAALVLGLAMALFALRAMAGRANARPMLLQLVVAQAALGLGGYALQRDVRAAEQDLEAAAITAKAHELPQQNPGTDRAVALMTRATAIAPGIYLMLRTLGSALIVLALTRPRSREFFDAAHDPAVEQ